EVVDNLHIGRIAVIINLHSYPVYGFNGISFKIDRVVKIKMNGHPVITLGVSEIVNTTWGEAGHGIGHFIAGAVSGVFIEMEVDTVNVHPGFTEGVKAEGRHREVVIGGHHKIIGHLKHVKVSPTVIYFIGPVGDQAAVSAVVSTTAAVIFKCGPDDIVDDDLTAIG